MKRPVVAILADFPLWRVTGRIPASNAHYAVWLEALYRSDSISEDCDIHWLTLCKCGEYFSVNEGNHTFHAIPAERKSIGVLTGYWADRKSIGKVIGSISPDLVHAWGTEHAYALAGGDFKGEKVLSMQGIITAYCQRSKMPWFFRVQQYWERLALRRYKHITVESSWGRDRLLELVPDADVRLIEYGVEPRWSSLEKKLAPTPVCLYGGSISDTKGSRALVDCFCKPELAHIELRLAGTGSDELVGELKEKATANITFLGRVSRDGMEQELAQAWCLIHPTLADTSPNIVKEARCAATPVISTPEGGQTQYIDDGLSGYICPVNDADAFARAVLSVCESPGKSLAMGLHGVERCREALSSKLTAEKFTNLYLSLLPLS